MIEELPREAVAVVDDVIVELLQSAGISAPPVDAIALAQKQLKMVVCLDRNQPQRGRAQRAAGRRQIYLRPEPTEERHQWTVAHEIGEHFKTQLLERLGLPPGRTPATAGEDLANLFAFRLLVPSVWFNHDAPDLAYDVLALKKRYRTASHEVVAWRFLDLTEPCTVTIIDNGQIYKRSDDRKELSEIEQQCQRRVQQTAEPQCLQANGWTVQGWPIHRADWKREILRSVVEASG